MKRIGKHNKALMLADRFYRLHHKSEERTFRKITDSLLALSLRVRPDVWRQFRNAVSYEASYLGNQQLAENIKNLFNPTTININDPRISNDKKSIIKLSGRQPKKQNRCRRVPEKDHSKIIEHLTKNLDPAVLGALLLAYFTGIRPAEMLEMELIPAQNAIFINTAKQTEKGDRGLSRELTFSQAEYEIIEQAYFAVQSEKLNLDRSGNICKLDRTMKRIQNRLAAITEKIFPRRVHRITLYSYRHQMGSNLKASGFDHIAIAAIMGHQCVNSIDKYGNAKSATRPAVHVSLRRFKSRSSPKG